MSLGHIKHHDVQVMMVASFLPALFYYIGYSMMLSGIFGGGRKKNSGGNNALIGIAFMAFSWVLTLFTLYLSRLREYYADRHSVSVVENGADKLSTGLVTIVEESKRGRTTKERRPEKPKLLQSIIHHRHQQSKRRRRRPSRAKIRSKQDLLRDTLAKQPTKGDKFVEIFSTHPNIIKRLRALQELSITKQSTPKSKTSLPTKKGLLLFSSPIIDVGPCPG